MNTSFEIEAESLSQEALAMLNEPQLLLDEPEPGTPLCQQVGRLTELGLHKVAAAVKACGRVGQVCRFQCGRGFLRMIIHANRRFCCKWCDLNVAEHRFKDHKSYLELLDPAGTLHLVTIQSSHYELSGKGIRDFENAACAVVGQWLKKLSSWGFKAMTHYEEGHLVFKGIIALPEGVALPSLGFSIAFGTITIGSGRPITDFEPMLRGILRTSLTEGHGIARADLMAAFYGGRHLRSLGILVGRVSKIREQRKEANLHPSVQAQSGASCDSSIALPSSPLPTLPPVERSLSGQGASSSLSPDDVKDFAVSAGSCTDGPNLKNKTQPRTLAVSPSRPIVRRSQNFNAPYCPHCGPGCHLVAVEIVPLDKLEELPNFHASWRGDWSDHLRLSLNPTKSCQVGAPC